MENATKALLIAAAVLVAIIIISITLVIVNQGQEAASGADISELEAAEFNAPFVSYEGSNVSTDKVNALLNTVFQHNKKELSSGENRYVAVIMNSSRGSNNVLIETSNVSTTNTVPSLVGSNYWKVTCNYTGSIITSIKLTQNR